MNGVTAHCSIKLDKVRVGYKSKKATLFSSPVLDFELPKQGLISLIGPNGIGKSTLIRSLCGVQDSLEGHIYVKGQDLYSLDANARAKEISVVLTQPPASRNLTVAEFVALGRYPHTDWLGSVTENDRKLIEAAMQQTDTLKLAEKHCTQLSDGQLQRAAIARALAQDTPIMLLDEPLTHLDLYHRAAVLKLLKELVTANHKLILFSTHEIELAIRHSDQMLVLTAEHAFFDQPEILVSLGRFDQLFPENGPKFDAVNRRFEL